MLVVSKDTAINAIGASVPTQLRGNGEQLTLLTETVKWPIWVCDTRYAGEDGGLKLLAETGWKLVVGCHRQQHHHRQFVMSCNPALLVKANLIIETKRVRTGEKQGSSAVPQRFSPGCACLLHVR